MLGKLALTAEMMAGDQNALAKRLAPRKRISLTGILAGWTKRLVAGGRGLPADAGGEGARTSVWDALHALLREDPVLLTADEAQEMLVDFGRDLLQAAQDFVAAGLPLFVVLAGTLGLRPTLGSCGLASGCRHPDKRL